MAEDERLELLEKAEPIKDTIDTSSVGKRSNEDSIPKTEFVPYTDPRMGSPNKSNEARKENVVNQ